MAATMATVTGLAAAPTAAGQRRVLHARSSLAGAPVRMSRPSATCSRKATSVRAATAAESMGVDTWNKSYYPTGEDTKNVAKQWYIIDAEGQTLGRLASLAAVYIRGKNSPTYTPSQDMGSYVIVINAEKVQVTGRKATQKTYFRHTQGRPGGWRVETFDQLQQRIPERIVEKAVWGMLPKGRMGREVFNHLKVFAGSDHPHDAQRPIDITSNINVRAGKSI